MAKYRVGIIGTGEIARAHARGYQQVPQCDIVAACDVSAEALRRFAYEFGVPRLYSDYRAMLEREKLDIVSICTYPTTRCEIALACAQAGIKGIYCEKPMCMDLAEADAMCEAAEKAGSVLIVGHQRRFVDPWKKAKELLDSGAIGKLHRLEACCPKWDIFEWGTHWMDIFRFYNDDVPASFVIAQIDRRWDRTGYGHRLETECIAHIGFQNGVHAFFESGDHASPGFYNRLIGTEGMIEVHMPDQPALRAFTRDGLLVPELERADPFKLCIDALIESIETGKPHILNGRSARAAHELIMAVYESALMSKLVELPLKRTDNPFGQVLERAGLPLVLS